MKKDFDNIFRNGDKIIDIHLENEEAADPCVNLLPFFV